MPTLRVTILVTGIVLVACATARGQDTLEAWRTDLRRMQLIPIQNGTNSIDLDGDGGADIVVRARRGNFNAHGFDYVTFYYIDHTRPDSLDRWNLVPFFAAGGPSRMNSFATREGADCVLSDIRVLRRAEDTSSPVVVVVGQREMGQSYADMAAVTFTVYDVARNADGLPGWPALYFQEVAVISAQSLHCDVGEAFEQELGIGR